MTEPGSTPESKSEPQEGSRYASADLPELTGLKGDELEAAKTRAEVQTLLVSLQELRVWRSKLIFSSLLTVLTPIGSVLLFFVGWYGSHANERRHQEDDLYARAARQLADKDGSVRLSAVLTLQHFVGPQQKPFFGRISEGLFARSSAEESRERSQTAMALLVGSLSREDDPAVLDAIGQAAAQGAEDSLTPLVALNKSAVVQFARAAGEYSGLSALRMMHKRSFQIDYWKGRTQTRDAETNKVTIDDPTITDLVILLLRSGSPFEVAAKVNQRFSARDFLTTPKCNFRELFLRQQTLATGEGFNSDLRNKVPRLKETAGAMKETMQKALLLERTSYILGALVNDHWDKVAQWMKEPGNTLYGTAIVVGELTPERAASYRASGGYYTSSFEADANPGCRTPRE